MTWRVRSKFRFKHDALSLSLFLKYVLGIVNLKRSYFKKKLGLRSLFKSMKTYKNMNSIDQCLRTLSQDWQALLHEVSDTVCESNLNRTAGLTTSTSQSQPWNILVDLKWQKILVMLKVKKPLSTNYGKHNNLWIKNIKRSK